jgi:hypothetical protein
MTPSFLLRYLDAFHSIEGWFQYDAALLFMAYHQLAAAHGVAGDTLEIGVHHGLSAIATAALRTGRFHAVDLFEELQTQNVSDSGGGDRAVFESNMRRFYPDLDFMHVMARPSSELSAEELGSGFSFCHIDGGHSRRETLSDLRLASSILQPGGMLALDDYFNPEYPGVCEGAVEFMLSHPQALRPAAIGYNKAIFQKLPAPWDLHAEFAQAFPWASPKTVQLWDQPALLFPGPFRYYIDLQASTPERFVPRGSVQRASILPAVEELSAAPGEKLLLAVSVGNLSEEPFPAGERVFGLSYHLLAPSGEELEHDHERAWLAAPLAPGNSVPLELAIEAPAAPGRYRLEIDLVWEGVMWFKDAGNPAAYVDLTVT